MQPLTPLPSTPPGAQALAWPAEYVAGGGTDEGSSMMPATTVRCGGSAHVLNQRCSDAKLAFDSVRACALIN